MIKQCERQIIAYKCHEYAVKSLFNVTYLIHGFCNLVSYFYGLTSVISMLNPLVHEDYQHVSNF